MNDLVKRLRAMANWDDAPWWWDSPEKTFGEDSPASLATKAADEIERLRRLIVEEYE